MLKSAQGHCDSLSSVLLLPFSPTYHHLCFHPKPLYHFLLLSSRLPMISILLKSTVRVSRLILLNGSAVSDISDHWLLEILSLLGTQEGTLYCFVSPLTDCTVPVSLPIPPLYPSFVSWMLKHFTSKACVSLLNGSLVRLPLTTSALLPWSEPLSSLTWLLQQLPSWSSPSCTSVCPQHGRQRGPVKICLVMSLLHKTLPWLSVSLRVKVEVLTVSFKTPSGPTTYRPTSLILLLSHCHSRATAVPCVKSFEMAPASVWKAVFWDVCIASSYFNYAHNWNITLPSQRGLPHHPQFPFPAQVNLPVLLHLSHRSHHFLICYIMFIIFLPLHCRLSFIYWYIPSMENCTWPLWVGMC